MTALGLDIGTTGVKAVVVSSSGHILGEARRDYPLITPKPGWVELDPIHVLRKTRAAIREAVSRAGKVPEAVGLSSAGEAFIPVDTRSRPLANAIVSFDTRALGIFGQLMADGGAAQFEQITGLRPLAHYAVSKLKWWRENHPEWFAEGARFMTLGGYIVGRIGGDAVIDPSLAVRTLVYDARSDGWSPELVARAGIDVAELPRIQPSRSRCGAVTAGAAASLGLRKQAPIAAGGLDQACAALGAAVSDDIGLLSIGTTAVIAVRTDDRTRIPLAIPSVPSVDGAGWLAIAGSPAGGSVLRWFRDTSRDRTPRRNASYSDLIEAVDGRRTDVLFLPHLGGSRIAFDDPAATGAFLGLTFKTDVKDLARAVLDGVAYEIALLLERLGSNGLVPKRLRAVGGGSLSRSWMQTVSDVCGLPVESTESSYGAAFGAALLGGALIQGGELDVRLPSMPIRFRVKPRPEWREYHRGRLERFGSAHAALQAERVRLA